MPEGVAGLVVPRSGLAAGHGVTTLNAPGLIDPNYRGEVKVILHNAGAEPYEVAPGDRIAQLVIAPTVRVGWSEVSAVSDTGRGEGGFGSTGQG